MMNGQSKTLQPTKSAVRSRVGQPISARVAAEEETTIERRHLEPVILLSATRAAEGARCQSTVQRTAVLSDGPLRTGLGGLLFTSKIKHYYCLYFVHRILHFVFMSTSEIVAS